VAADSTGVLRPRQRERYDLAVLRPFQRMPRMTGVRLASRAAQHPLAAPSVAYESWYLQRWHCLPEGYLSRRSVRLYDRFVVPLYSCGREPAIARLVAEACAGASDVLELGCGTGRLLSRLARSLQGARLGGVDLSPFAVEVATARLRHAPGVVEVVHGDARSLPWPEASFDVVVASHLLGHLPPAVAAAIVAEARRVLRADGTMVTVEHAWHRVAMPGFRERSRRGAALGLVVVRSYSLAATGSVANPAHDTPGSSHGAGSGRTDRPVE
jgi:SAM-dependent methyltransferase